MDRVSDYVWSQVTQLTTLMTVGSKSKGPKCQYRFLNSIVLFWSNDLGCGVTARDYDCSTARIQFTHLILFVRSEPSDQCQTTHILTLKNQSWNSNACSAPRDLKNHGGSLWFCKSNALELQKNDGVRIILSNHSWIQTYTKSKHELSLSLINLLKSVTRWLHTKWKKPKIN